LQNRGHHDAKARAVEEVRGMEAEAMGDAGVPRNIAPVAAPQRACITARSVRITQPLPHIAAAIPYPGGTNPLWIGGNSSDARLALRLYVKEPCYQRLVI